MNLRGDHVRRLLNASPRHELPRLWVEVEVADADIAVQKIVRKHRAQRLHGARGSYLLRTAVLPYGFLDAARAVASRGIVDNDSAVGVVGNVFCLLQDLLASAGPVLLRLEGQAL